MMKDALLIIVAATTRHIDIMEGNTDSPNWCGMYISRLHGGCHDSRLNAGRMSVTLAAVNIINDD